MSGILVSILIVVGSCFILLAAVGVLRFPDLFTRMHAATKAGAFGGGILALAAGIHFASAAIWIEALLLVLFFYSTMPVAAHLIARAAFRGGTKPAPETDTRALEGFEHGQK
jgi:multicomponent Na+:H+ antiporter subunit G